MRFLSRMETREQSTWTHAKNNLPSSQTCAQNLDTSRALSRFGILGGGGLTLDSHCYSRCPILISPSLCSLVVFYVSSTQGIHHILVWWLKKTLFQSRRFQRSPSSSSHDVALPGPGTVLCLEVAEGFPHQWRMLIAHLVIWHLTNDLQALAACRHRLPEQVGLPVLPLHQWCILVPQMIPERKSSPKSKFGAGHPADVHTDIPADVQGEKLRLGPRNPRKASISVRASKTRRRGRPWPQVFFCRKNFGQKHFGLHFRSLMIAKGAFAGKSHPWTNASLGGTFFGKLSVPWSIQILPENEAPRNCQRIFPCCPVKGARSGQFFEFLFVLGTSPSSQPSQEVERAQDKPKRSNKSPLFPASHL